MFPMFGLQKELMRKWDPQMIESKFVFKEKGQGTLKGKKKKTQTLLIFWFLNGISFGLSRKN